MDTTQVRYGYVCGVDFAEHMAQENDAINDPMGARVYGSLESLKKENVCCSCPPEYVGTFPLHCAIYKVKVTIEEVIREGMGT